MTNSLTSTTSSLSIGTPSSANTPSSVGSTASSMNSTASSISSISVSSSASFSSSGHSSALMRQRKRDPMDSDSDDDEVIAFPDIYVPNDMYLNTGAQVSNSAEQVAIQMRTQSVVLSKQRADSLQSIFTSLGIPKEEWGTYEYGIQEYYAVKDLTEDTVEPHLVSVQGKCLSAKGKVPLLLLNVIFWLSGIPESDKEKILASLLKKSGSEKSEKKED